MLTVVCVLIFIIFAGCFYVGYESSLGEVPTITQLQGRWNLIETQHGSSVYTEDSREWIIGCFIEFDGFNFIEADFWNYTSGNDATSFGSFTLNGNDLILTRNGGIDLRWSFVPDRRIYISGDGSTLFIRYTRQQGFTYRYIHTFTREGAFTDQPPSNGDII